MKEHDLLHGWLDPHCTYTFQVKIESNGLIFFREHRRYQSRDVGDPYGDGWLELAIPSGSFDTFFASVIQRSRRAHAPSQGHKHDELIHLLKQLASDGLFHMPSQPGENLQVIERWLKETGIRYRKSSSAHFQGLDE
jgi:hypothetical protein